MTQIEREYMGRDDEERDDRVRIDDNPPILVTPVRQYLPRNHTQERSEMFIYVAMIILFVLKELKIL